MDSEAGQPHLLLVILYSQLYLLKGHVSIFITLL